MGQLCLYIIFPLVRLLGRFSSQLVVASPKSYILRITRRSLRVFRCLGSFQAIGSGFSRLQWFCVFPDGQLSLRYDTALERYDGARQALILGVWAGGSLVAALARGDLLGQRETGTVPSKI